MFWSRNICLSLHLGSSESHKTLEKSLSMSALHPGSLFFVFSHYHVSTDDIAPFSAYKHTHNSQFLYSCWWSANAPNISFETLNSGQFMLTIQLIIPNYLVILSHWCSITVSWETYPLPHWTTPATLIAPNYTYCTKVHLCHLLLDFMIE